MGGTCGHRASGTARVTGCRKQVYGLYMLIPHLVLLYLSQLEALVGFRVCLRSIMWYSWA